MIARIPPLIKIFRERARKLFFFSGPFFVSRLMLPPPPENKIVTDLIFSFDLFIKMKLWHLFGVKLFGKFPPAQEIKKIPRVKYQKRYENFYQGHIGSY